MMKVDLPGILKWLLYTVTDDKHHTPGPATPTTILNKAKKDKKKS